MRAFFAIVAVLFAALPGACATSAVDAPHGTPSWREGWADGCNFARGMSGWGTGWTVDVTRRQSDADYAAGLNAGARYCG
ncbi:hypothetical protein KFF05_02070 [bacterium SCSIO 12827]|nr:hypothetical protein KFF05_02070 [bacterium SCSIO 12827]